MCPLEKGLRVYDTITEQLRCHGAVVWFSTWPNSNNTGHVYSLCYNGHQRRRENVHVLGRWSIRAVQTRIQLVIQLVEMAKIQSAIKRPAA
jgi:hypothetical protein